MRLPQHLLESPYFLFSSLQELVSSLGEFANVNERADIQRLSDMGLPPVTSKEALAAMFGVNPGLIWSFQHRSVRHYRSFEIKKGTGYRRIDAPKVGLKMVQKWLSVHFQKVFAAPDHVFGFVPGRSHIDAAKRHCSASWVFSVDIENFFPSTPQWLVRSALERIGYTPAGAELIAALSCLRGFLAQGAPTSPVISNMVFQEIDIQLAEVAQRNNARLTRYADDIVFSGIDAFPENLQGEVEALFLNRPWKLAQHKTSISRLPNRLKVHGLLVHGDSARLTKGYRKRVRAFRHLMAQGRVRDEDVSKLKGHLEYARQVELSDASGHTKVQSA